MPFQPQPLIQDLVQTGTLTSLTSSLVLQINSVSSIKIFVTGTWVGTVQIQQTIDDINWYNVRLSSETTQANLTGIGTTVNDLLLAWGFSGVDRIRAIFTSYTSGTATVTIRASDGINKVISVSTTNDGSGSPINSYNSQLEVADIINTAGQDRAQSVTSTVSEALGAATILANRKFISMLPTNGTIYWGFTNAVTTTTGTPIMKNQSTTIAVGSNVHIYVIAAQTTDVRIAEGS